MWNLCLINSLEIDKMRGRIKGFSRYLVQNLVSPLVVTSVCDTFILSRIDNTEILK